MQEKLSPPKFDELEVSIFGPGFGESIAIHVGSGTWIVIDSCIDSITQRPAPLAYLESLSVDPKEAIELVVATHWHADHVRGLHDLYSAAASAKFCCSVALTSKEFISLAKLYSAEPGHIPLGPEELYRCLETAKKRTNETGSTQLRWAMNDRLLWQAELENTAPATYAKLTALSPSDPMVSRFLQGMVNSLTVAKKGFSEGRLVAGTPNDVAVALLLEIHGRKILLGSDLEEEGNASFGWSAVMRSVTAQFARCCTFKVAHHGSATARFDPVWGKLLETQPLALLTPFRHGSHQIPDPDERAYILGKTGRAYITANPKKNANPEKRLPKIQTLMKATVKNLRRAASPVGHIRWRAPINSPGDLGTIELYDGAIPLAEVV